MVYCGIFLHNVQNLGIEIIRSEKLSKDIVCFFTDHPIIFASVEATGEAIDSAVALIVGTMADKPHETSDSWRPESSR